MVEEGSTKNDEPCHEMREIEDEEVVEDGPGRPYDGSEGGVQPGDRGDDR